MSLFASVAMAPPDPILGVTQAWRADTSPDKLNLGVGAYRSEEGQPWVLPTVKDAEAELLKQQEAGKINKEYLPIDGIPEFYNASVKLMLGEDSAPIKEGRACIVQCLSGTGGLRLAAAVIGNYMKGKAIYIPNPTWGNHKAIFPQQGVEVKQYRYYKPATCGLDFEGMMEDLKAMPSGSVVLLHACAHNPTGVDPTEEQWKAIADVIKEKGLFPMMDSAYQGFASGDFDKDAWACRYFASLGVEMMLIQSFAKNMGLYGERTGTFTTICVDKDSADRLKSQIKILIRTMYSSPPAHGARIAALILNDPARLTAWKAEVKIMADRIINMRKELHAALLANGCPGTWDHVINQIGMFTFTGLKPGQVEHLTSKHHIYLTKDGRISMAGLNGPKVKYLADAMKDAITSVTA
uniref:aspartate transaminase n=1 Tax=Eutreptiella gymnastica TaxID=73025 RepID=A0A7S4G3Y9_9EUGL|mmetsp:Transcript_18129/g.29967  ORF Transcript_18129/g.29967 Transcript_18129/m.29967 type:complete len:409 (+) Transcript_18129:20-1246(+)